MKIKFANGTTLTSTSLIEQKVFGKDGSSGWVISFSIITPMTSNETDELLTTENIAELQLLSDDESYAKTLIGYNKITMVIVRYSDDVSSAIEVQLSKGI